MNASTQYRDALPPGTRLSQFEFVEVLGRGGFGITYRGWDASLGITVAIKEYMPSEIAVRESDGAVYPRTDGHTGDYELGLDEFLEEAKKLARFKHPGIVPVRHIFQGHRTAYIVMEYLEGGTLFELYESEDTLGEERLRDLLSPILEGLEQVHEAGFLHCDIKPGNIMLRDGVEPVLIDFGAAQVATAEHSRMVPVVMPGYSPLEQYLRGRGNRGPWTDIYSVGAVLYRGMTGVVPSESLLRVESDDLAPVAQAAKRPYGERLTRAVDWALRMRGSERPQSIEVWREVLEGRAAAPGGGGREVSRKPDGVSPGGRRWLAVIGTVAVLAVAGGAWWWNETASLSPSVLEQRVAEVRALLGRGDLAGARLSLDEARALGLNGTTRTELANAIDEAEVRRRREALVAEAGALRERGDFAGARARVGEARALGLDAAEHAALAKGIDDAELARELSRCGELSRAGDWDGLGECAGRVLELDERNDEARKHAKNAKVMPAAIKASKEKSVESYYALMQATDPGERLHDTARRKMKEMEDGYWTQVEREDTPEGYDRYLTYYPQGEHAPEARARR